MQVSPGLHPYQRLGRMEALEGGRILERKLEVLTHDLANISTDGFKAQDVTFREALAAAQAGERRVAKVEKAWTDFSPGPLVETGNPLDFAVDGEGFFAVQTPAGVRYTRAGGFTLNALNELVTAEGYRVLGDGAPITLEDTTGRGIWLSEDGYFFVDEAQTGRLDVVKFDRPEALVPAGGNLYEAPAAAGPPTPSAARIRQGFIERSNVNGLKLMVELMELQRAYEVQLRAIQSADQLDGRAVNEVGKVA
ncbi:flagellar basal-body rod protein FlgF [Dissulfurirhabdus thermomarina]|uniref:Flagellar basal-body rod protein FlgF n=1 Tax=Dissulfurirhabdus thermomarina TaxID=1765737 RepID=A0A6N9TLV1_DISTH|nr:flagellar basal-body rod protein FlgF [Dissulfurirhabdus thermomarina]NDY42261.1 flagellar basal-body rod protein FlgF [Dissulfurirhabdus thermomarina]NMX22766.1 flagellar basal-body rod protein FlgF [Dissulfurirhabdus thermomarina]